MQRSARASRRWAGRHRRRRGRATGSTFGRPATVGPLGSSSRLFVRSGRRAAGGGLVLGRPPGAQRLRATGCTSRPPAGLLHGLVPYRDFVLLHPPGMLVLGAGPMAAAFALGLTDSDALALMRVIFVCLGGVNTVLAFFAGRHLSRAAGVVAGRSLRRVGPGGPRGAGAMLLEALVILGTVTALSLVPAVSSRDVSGRWRPVLAGVVGGLAVATKLWAVVPILVIVGSLFVVGRWRRALAYGTHCRRDCAGRRRRPSWRWRPARCGTWWSLPRPTGPSEGRTGWPGSPRWPTCPPGRCSVLVDPGVPTRPVDPNAALTAFFGTGRGAAFTAGMVLLVTAGRRGGRGPPPASPDLGRAGGAAVRCAAGHSDLLLRVRVVRRARRRPPGRRRRSPRVDESGAVSAAGPPEGGRRDGGAGLGPHGLGGRAHRPGGTDPAIPGPSRRAGAVRGVGFACRDRALRSPERQPQERMPTCLRLLRSRLHLPARRLPARSDPRGCGRSPTSSRRSSGSTSQAPTT